MKIKVSLILVLLAIASTFGQSGHGLTFDNYNSIYGITINPAFSSESKSRWQINGFSYSNLNFTDVGKISPLSFDYVSIPKGFNGIDYGSSSSSENSLNNMHTERDWLWPSVIFKASDRLAFGLLLRSRAFTNYSDFNGSLFKMLNTGQTVDTYQGSILNFTNTSHHWNEVGLNFSYAIVINDFNVVKIGGTAKWLQGMGALNITGTDFTTSLSGDQLSIESGTITYLNTFRSPTNPGIDGFNDIVQGEVTEFILTGPVQSFFNEEPTSAQKDFGGDIGLVWELRASGTNRVDRGISESSVNLYKLKLSASVQDLGNITYKNDPNRPGQSVLNDSLTVANSFNENVSSFGTNSLIAILRDEATENVTRRQPRGEVVVALPTALNVNIDYLINNDKNYYVNFNYLHPVRENTEAFSNQRMQLLTVTPRLEKPDWSIYVPISYGFETNFAIGIGGRYKYVTAGLSIPELGGVNYLYVGFNAPINKL